MLVLTRKLREQISIGQDITITILRVKSNTVRIGIDAPASVRVLRGELPRHETPRSVSSEPLRDTHAPGGPERAETHQPRAASGGGQGRGVALAPLVSRVTQRCGVSENLLVSAAAAVE